MAKKRKTNDVPELAQSNGIGFAADGAGADNKRKKSAASRIGRACDRCQHRKLACDPSPNGCPPCQKVHAWCTVTDPLTGTPTYRGEFEYLEKRVEKQQRDIQNLLNRLRSLGQEAEYAEDDTAEDRRYNAWKRVKDAGDTRPWDRDERSTQSSKNSGPPPVPQVKSEVDENGYTERASDRGSKEPVEMPEPLAPESYVGLATARGHPVSSRLNMFGWEIDLASFTTPDADDPKSPAPSHDNPIYDKSYRAGLASIYGTQRRCEEPHLGSKQEMVQYASMFVQVLNVYTPVLHKNKYFTMVNEVMGNPNASPTVAQKVILHMSVATLLWHSAVRNNDETRSQLEAMADQHYHFCLALFGDLLVGDSLEDIQALALICLYARNFPKPEICWAISYRSFARLIELSYHRAPRNQRGDNSKLSIYETEMQKRLFWVIFVCCIVTSEKLGRPMPMRREDFDVDYPASIPDDALSDAGVDKQISQQQPCEFQPHIEMCKLTPIYMDVCSTIYTARKSRQGRKAFVEETEQRLKTWHAQLPDKYKKSCDDESINDLDRMSISFLNFFMFELRLLIHHPSLSMGKGGTPNTDDLRVCLDVSHGMLQVVKQMQRMRALECTWHTCALFMLAIQTTLYAHGMLKDEITSEKFDQCRQDMTAWLSIIGDMGALLGSKNKLQDKVRIQIQGGIASLQMAVQAKARIANKLAAGQNTARQEVKNEEIAPANGHPQTPQMSNPTQYANYGNGMNAVNDPTSGHSADYGQPQAAQYQDLQTYQALPQQNYPYPSPSTGPANANAYTVTGTSTMSNQYQTAPATTAYNLQQQMAHHPHPTASPVSPYTSQPQQAAYTSNGYYGPYGHQDPAATTTWFQYTQALNAAGLTGSPHSSASGHTTDYQPAAASALLQLGNAGGARNDGGLMGAEMHPGLNQIHNYGAVAAAQQWPLGFMEDASRGFDTSHG